MGMKYCGAYLMAVLGGNDSPKKDDIQKILESAGIEFDDAIAEKLVSELHGKTVHEVIAVGKGKLAAFGGGGGGGGAVGGGGGGSGAAQSEQKKEEKTVEAEEEEEDMDFDLFG